MDKTVSRFIIQGKPFFDPLEGLSLEKNLLGIFIRSFDQTLEHFR